jgi:amino acid transporter
MPIVNYFLNTTEPKGFGDKQMNLLKNNIGKIDRIIRIVVGIILVGNVFYALQNPIGWLGVILIVTGIAGICPLYSILGINTKSAAEKIGIK